MFGTRYQYRVLCSEVLADEEDALSVACDMGYVAVAELLRRGVDRDDITRDPEGFQEALDAFFEQARREVPLAAE